MKTVIAFAIAMLSSPVWALSEQGQTSLESLQQQWAHIRYELPEKQREAAFAKLATQAEAAVKQEPAAELMIWQGIIYSTWAGAKGGLGALGLVKQAKASLEQALQLDDQALQGSAYTSLGALYYQVPGWPIAFGDDDKAEELLKHALEINPQGIDPNYFYADYLMRQKRYAEALQALQRAEQAAPRLGREVADQGRHVELQALAQQLTE